MIGTQIAREAAAATEDTSVVLCDRAIFDIVSHTQLIRSDSERTDALLSALWGVASAWSRTYDLVLMTTIDERIPPVADGLRVADSGYRRLVAAKLVEVMEAMASPVTILPPNMRDAAEAAWGRIRELMHSSAN